MSMHSKPLLTYSYSSKIIALGCRRLFSNNNNTKCTLLRHDGSLFKQLRTPTLKHSSTSSSSSTPGRPTLLVQLLQNRKFTRGMKYYLVGIAIFLFPAAGSFYSFTCEPSPHIPREQFILHTGEEDILTKFVRVCERLFVGARVAGEVVEVNHPQHKRVVQLLNDVCDGNEGLSTVDKTVSVIASKDDSTQCCKGELRFTTGLLEKLSDDELVARISHELSHGVLKHTQEQASQFFFISLFGFIMTGLPFLPLMPLGIRAEDLAEKISTNSKTAVPSPAETTRTMNRSPDAVKQFNMRAFWRRNGLSLALLVPLLVYSYMKHMYPHDIEKEADDVSIVILSRELKEGTRKKMSEEEIIQGYRF